jgi:hypothetical protein
VLVDTRDHLLLCSEHPASSDSQLDVEAELDHVPPPNNITLSPGDTG